MFYFSKFFKIKFISKYYNNRLKYKFEKIK